MSLLREHGLRSARQHAADLGNLLDALDPEEKPDVIGLTRREIGNYSILRALGEVYEMCRQKQPWRLSGVEGEAHRTLEKKHGPLASAAAFYVPPEIQHRDLTAAAAGAGGYLVATTTGGSYIERLRNTSVVFRLGAQRLPGQRENLAIPQLSASASATWLSTEATQATESQQTFKQVSSTPKHVAGYTEISRQLLKQSNPAAEQVVMGDLGAILAVAADLAFLNGTGTSGQPLGLLGTSGIGTFSGTTLALAALTEAQQDILDGNALLDPRGLGYATTPAVAKLLKNRQRFTSTDTPLWQGPLHDGTIEGVRALSSNQIPSATMIYGDWSQVLVPEWGVLAVELNPYANFLAGIVGVRAIWSVDVIFRHIESFTVSTSIT
jgi:HK97 family phage major capsid protein